VKISEAVLRAAAACLLFASSRAAGAAQGGHVVIARASADALLIFDATVDVIAAVSRKLNVADANTMLQHDALRALSHSLPHINRKSRSVRVSIVYYRTAAVSPAYGSATFAGVDRYALLEMSMKDALRNRDNWRRLSGKMALPAWINFKITGSLPAR